MKSFLLLSLLGVATIAIADDPTQPRRVSLAITPAAEPNPALRYQLLPAIHERKPGNAAQYYYRALLNIKGRHFADHWKEHEKNYERWNKSLAELPADEVRKWLQPFGRVFADVRTATYRERCDWEWRLEQIEGVELFAFVLEEIQSARDLARVLVLKARLEIKEGKFDEALQTLRDGYQLAVNVTTEPLLINGLVGVAIASMLNEAIIDWIAQPNSPNLYWAMTALPKPLIDMRPALALEAAVCERALPFLRDAETAQRSSEEWLRLIGGELEKLHQLAGTQVPSAWEKAAFFAAIPAAYTQAKRELVAGGFDEKKLDAMPVGQVLAIQSRRAANYTAQEVLKNALLDSPDAAERIAATEQRLRRDGWMAPPMMGKDPFGIAGVILPALGSVTSASHRLQRNVAAIQALEALRMQASETGKLPASLDEVKIVPVPLNPATGKPFPYRVEGAAATFELPQIRFPQDGAVYTLTLEPRK